MTDQQTLDGQPVQEQGQAQFGLLKIFVKDMSFESPQGFNVFHKQHKPKVSQDLNTQVSKLDDTHFEVVLKLTVTVKDQDDDSVLFLVEVHQAGVFGIAGIEGLQMQQLLTSGCPQILFPYAREAIDSLVVRGGFPPLALPPINFDAIFAQILAESQARADGQVADA